MKMNKLAALFIIAIVVSPNLTIVRGQTLTLAPFDANTRRTMRSPGTHPTATTSS
jgi:hypothetical protein